MGSEGGTPPMDPDRAATLAANVQTAPSTSGTARPKARPNAGPLVAVLAGAGATALWGCGLLPGGWLGVDVALTAVGVMVARPSARPRGFRSWRGAGGRTPVLRLGVGIAAVTFALVALALQLGRTAADSGVRGDLFAAGLQFANLRGAGGAPHALDRWPGAPTSQLWLLSLLVQVGVAAAIVHLLTRGRPAPRRAQRSFAAAAVAVALATAVWGLAGDWSVQAIVLLPSFRVIGVAAGFAAARWIRTLEPELVRLWPVPLIALAGLAATASVSASWAPIAAVGAVVAAVWILLARPLELPSVERNGAWLAWAGAAALVAGPASAALGLGGATGAVGRIAAVVVVVGASLALGWEARVIERSVPAGDLAQVIAAPLCVGLLVAALASAGFFRAPPPEIVDAARFEQPDGALALTQLVDGLPAPDAFCEDEAVEQLGEHLGSMMVSIVDEQRAEGLLAETEPDWEPLLAGAPDPTISADLAVVRDQAVSLMPALGQVGSLIDQGDVLGLGKVIETDPGVLSFLRLTFYLERRCGIIVSS